MSFLIGLKHGSPENPPHRGHLDENWESLEQYPTRLRSDGRQPQKRSSAAELRGVVAIEGAWTGNDGISRI